MLLSILASCSCSIDPGFSKRTRFYQEFHSITHSLDLVLGVNKTEHTLFKIFSLCSPLLYHTSKVSPWRASVASLMVTSLTATLCRCVMRAIFCVLVRLASDQQ